MEYLKTFESFSSFENARIDKTTIKFIDGSITESQFIDYLNTEVYNEGVMDSIRGFVSNMKTKFIDVLYTFLKKAAENGMIVFNSFKKFINWLLDSLSDWKKENPKLFKIIIITAMIFLFLILSASTAYAQTTGVEIDVTQMDLALGLLSDMSREIVSDAGVSNTTIVNDINDAVKILKTTRGGNMTAEQFDTFSQASKNISSESLIKARELLAEFKNSNSSEEQIKTGEKLMKLIDKGVKFIGVVWEKSAGGGYKLNTLYKK